MHSIRVARIVSMAALFYITAVSITQAQTFTVIANINSNHYQSEGFIQGADGKLLGFDAGTGHGAIIDATLTGQVTNVYGFCSQPNCEDGSFPVGIFQAANGTIYGTTEDGGTNGKGALFKLSPDGEETVLYSFCSLANCTDGWNPYSGPSPTLQGGLIGTTFGGGAKGKGILYEVTSAGKFTRLYSFCGQTTCTDGSDPVSPPFQTADGTIYGTTNGGGQFGSGTIYTYTATAGLNTVYSFPTALDGFSAEPMLVQGADGNFYGVTSYLGQSGNGSVFQFTPQGVFTTLYSFCTAAGCTDGAGPTGLIQGNDGNLYGLTSVGGTRGDGTIFEVTPQGVLTVLYSFCQLANCLDGNGPLSLVQDTNGTFYGTTASGGTIGDGTAFSLSVGLGPFVKTDPGWGNVGATVGILGSNLTGTTSVTFNGTSATFKVSSDSYIEAEVPVGATSGTIQVATPGGTLNSNFPFQVLP
jgi:uncharacterized repeat protein (TIGR03803 family)